jgi:integrase
MKKGNGVKRDPNTPGHWMIDTAIFSDDGKRLRLHVRGYLKRIDAIRDLDRQVALLRMKKGSKPAKGSFVELCENYISHQRDLLKPTTFHDLERDVRSRIEKPFVGSTIEFVYSGDALEKWRKDFLSKTQKISQSRVNWILFHLEDLSNYAFRTGAIGEQGLRLGLIASERVRERIHPKKTYHVWTYEQFAAFIKTFDGDDRNVVLFQWLFFSGCRIGEALALQWSDVDFDQKLIHIIKNSSPGVGTGKTEIFTTKTEAGIRDIYLSDEMAKQLALLKAAYDGYPDDFVFFDKAPIGRMTVRRCFDQHTEMAGLPRIKIHEIRHSVNTWLLSKERSTDELKAITERLGRSSLKVTMDVYFHQKDTTSKDLAKEIDVAPGDPMSPKIPH